MSSYNNIEKIKYTKNTSEVVNLLEYIVFENEREQEKYIVFKFANNVNQQLLGMEFEVNQYDIDNALVEKSVVIYDKFLAKESENFVPPAKLKVNYACKTISVKLLKAAYDRFLWNEGEYEDNSYKFEHYFRDEQTRKPAEKEDKKGKKDKGEKKQKQSNKKFEIKNQTKKNIARFPAVFLAIIFILVSVFVGVSLYLFQQRSDKFTYENFGLRIVNDKDVSVYDYYGEEKELVIPQYLGEYTVVKIDSGAFEGLEKLENVTINASVTIEKHAFVNCKNLKFISSTYNIYVLCAQKDICTGSSTGIIMPNAFYTVN